MQSRRPLVSILMPVYNEQRSVARAVQSVIRQSVKDIEILVIDGRSDDRTVTVVRQLEQEYPQVRLLDNAARIIPSALNVGLVHARGEFVSRVDAHLTINDTYIETGLGVLAQHPEAAAVGGCRVGVAGTPTGKAVAAALSSRFGVGDSINHYAIEPQETDHASMGVYRTKVLREVGGWDEELRVNEDVDLDHRILAAGYTIRYDPAMVMHWSVQENLRAFGRQYRRYGRGKAGMVRKNGAAAVRLRHLAPPTLVIALATGAAAAAGGRGRLAAPLLVPYPLALAGAVKATDDPMVRSAADKLRLGGAFATMHLSWGLGFLEGLVFKAPPVASSGRPTAMPKPDLAHQSLR